MSNLPGLDIHEEIQGGGWRMSRRWPYQVKKGGLDSDEEIRCGQVHQMIWEVKGVWVSRVRPETDQVYQLAVLKEPKIAAEQLRCRTEDFWKIQIGLILNCELSVVLFFLVGRGECLFLKGNGAPQKQVTGFYLRSIQMTWCYCVPKDTPFIS